MPQKERRTYLITKLLLEQGREREINMPKTEQEQKRLLRSLLNIRFPGPADLEFLEVQNEYLQEEIRQKGIADFTERKPVQRDIYLWKGDITTLRCDAIVNAANSRMLGCFCPGHGCIDNAIHTYAGIQLRAACAELMRQQGHEEETGKAKITPAFNLPCNYVIHTVGPIITGILTEQDCELLASCYQACMALADQNGLGSIAFCCISTGEFHFPNDVAAEIAIRTVTEYKAHNNSGMKVVFNVFKENDYYIYRRLLGAD